MDFSFHPDDRATESDIEQKIVFPLLSSPEGLDIPANCIRTKESIRPYDIGKGEKRRAGFVPDYLIWYHSFPVMVVEVKSPRQSAQVAYDEAQQYAHVLNSRYATGINPAAIVVGTNGQQLLVGSWDSGPILDFDIPLIASAPRIPEKLFDFCSSRILEDRAKEFVRKLRRVNYFRAYNSMGGQAALRQLVPINTFAVDLAPVLKFYFSSETQFDSDEILDRGYVSSEETTKYDAVLETFLRDSLQDKHDQWAFNLEPTSKSESRLSSNIATYGSRSPQDGHLQLIIGGVGSGKSMFIRRYHRHLMPASIRARTRWVFLDFNTAPQDGQSIERWVCEQFIESFQAYNPEFDLYDLNIMEGIFSPLIAKREKSVYARLKKVAPREYEIESSRDLRTWSDQPELFVQNICRYFSSDKRDTIVVVFDNVDRLGKDEQIKIFSVAQWFKSLTKSYCLLQMRDETYERYKDDKPLDTYRTAIRFYIRPPRFTDVIKKRVRLAEEYIKNNLSRELSYVVESGKRITYSRDDLAHFLNSLYLRIFQAERNSARIVEALADKDTRRSLETFSRVITSGHLSPTSIASIAMGGNRSPVAERDIIRILMRTDYKYFSETSGAIKNIFIVESDWVRPSSLLSIEVLSFLIDRRREVGEIGLQGYFTIARIQGAMENLGFEKSDVLKCVDQLLLDGLVVPDQLVVKTLTESHCVKVHASGFMHLRILCERLEYLYGILTVFPFRDKERCDKVAQILLLENHGDVSFNKRMAAVRELRQQLADDIEYHTKSYSVFRSELRGTVLTLDLISNVLEKEQSSPISQRKHRLL